ncbi:MAG: DUF4382 domain-containing protein [Treponema sp.]|nr:DUF4382 domain-containing protein [Treponema sp.]
MKLFFKANKYSLLLLSTFLILGFSILFATCNLFIQPEFSPDDYDNLESAPDGDTRIIIGIHDAQQQARSIQGIGSLNLVVRQIVIIDTSGKQTIIMDEERTVDILSASRSNPVILSNVSVEPGVYKELRLVLSNNSTINVSGETHPIRVPSGESSGLKLKGPFEIPRGKLFTLYIELDTARSVSWNRGQGYMLSPVLRVSNGPNVLGIFRGNYSIAGILGSCETLLQLYDDHTARLRIADYPNYTLFANYNYNSIRRDLRLTNFNLVAPDLGRRELREVMSNIPDEIVLPVRQWSLDSIIAIDTFGFVCNLYRVDDFDFSEGVTFTEFTLNINYPGSSVNGKNVLTEIRFIDTGMPPLVHFSKFEGNFITEKILVPNNSIQGSSTRIHITSYLFDDIRNLNTEIGLFASKPTLFMTKSSFSESTDNIWQKPDVFNVIRGMTGQEFTISFQPRLNIKMHHDNFTNNRPLITWDSYPGASNGYFVLVLIPNKDEEEIEEGNNSFFTIGFHAFTNETQVRVNTSRITFTNTYSSIHEIPPKITNGDIIKIEVYVLDGSNTLNTATQKGAYLMDTIMFKR